MKKIVLAAVMAFALVAGGTNFVSGVQTSAISIEPTKTTTVTGDPGGGGSGGW
jgi:hypothetical protein